MTDQTNPTIALVILTLNASSYILPLFNSIAQQTRQPDRILVIDSSSSDNTIALLRAYPTAQTHIISQQAFDHDGTRQLATELIDADIYIFMTQDALPATPTTFENIIQALLSSSHIGCAYGKQLPHAGANPLGKHLRLFNYPERSQLKSMADKAQYGIKTCFNSDSFAAYKKSALQAIGGFPRHSIFGEDVYVAAKMLLHGLQIHYAATATVLHSHNFTLKQEFQRYIAIGTFHRQERWIVEEFTTATDEGLKFIFSEVRYLIRTGKIHWLPRAFASWIVKFIGYKLGFYRNVRV